MDRNLKKRLIRVASGQEPADLVLKNLSVFHVYTGEFIKCDIAIADGYIAGMSWEPYHGKEELDLNGKYATPGFIDAHMHIESSVMSPRGFAQASIPCGTTAVFADPHEIANVSGTDGLQYMLDATENIPMHVHIMLPSCVPATDLENSGATLTAKDLKPFLQHPRVMGLGELMNAPGVLSLDDEVLDKLCMPGLTHIDGHIPGGAGKNLMGYIAAGISNDHECTTTEEALDKLRSGMYVLIRGGSAAQNLLDLIPTINEYTASFCCFATDDIHAGDLLTNGHINKMVRMAVNAGVPVATALRMATVNTAKMYGREDLGRIAPGCLADILIFDDLQHWNPAMVFIKGQLVAENGKTLVDMPDTSYSKLANSVNIGEITEDTFKIPFPEDVEEANVIGLVPHQLITQKLHMKVKRENGFAVSDESRDLLKIAVIERHHATGNIGLGFIHGYGLKDGAIASTVAHDSHNLVIIGSNDRDMALAANEIKRLHGGMIVVQNGKVLGSLVLPIGGLMSDENAQTVSQMEKDLAALVHGMGVPEDYEPFMTPAFMSLPVIPEIKLTDIGLIDVENFCKIPLEYHMV